jgi:hypothetical protein
MLAVEMRYRFGGRRIPTDVVRTLWGGQLFKSSCRS